MQIINGQIMAEVLRTMRNSGLSALLLKYFPPDSCSKFARFAVPIMVLGERGIKWVAIYKIMELFST